MYFVLEDESDFGIKPLPICVFVKNSVLQECIGSWLYCFTLLFMLLLLGFVAFPWCYDLHHCFHHVLMQITDIELPSSQLQKDFII